MNIQLHKAEKYEWLVKYYRTILLVALLAYVAYIRFGLHKNVDLNHKTHSPVQWLQPSSLDEKFPVLISNKSWSINYSNIERILWESTVSTSGRFVVNSETADLLQQVSAQLPGPLESKESQRLTFLIAQSLPDSDAKGLAHLFNRYYLYEQEYRSSLSAITQAKGQEKLSLLKASRTNNKLLQERYFGAEIAEKLFDKKNITVNYLNDRRIINMNESLTKAQKREQLSVLKKNYKNTLSH